MKLTQDKIRELTGIKIRNDWEGDLKKYYYSGFLEFTAREKLELLVASCMLPPKTSAILSYFLVKLAVKGYDNKNDQIFLASVFEELESYIYEGKLLEYAAVRRSEINDRKRIHYDSRQHLSQESMMSSRLLCLYHRCQENILSCIGSVYTDSDKPSAGSALSYYYRQIEDHFLYAHLSYNVERGLGNLKPNNYEQVTKIIEAFSRALLKKIVFQIEPDQELLVSNKLKYLWEPVFHDEEKLDIFYDWNAR